MTEDKCEYYDNGKCDNFDLVNYNCDDSDNCAWYQLKRVEQENENLKKEVKQIGSDFIKKGDYARELEKENKELKAYKDVNEDFKKAWDELNKKYTEVLKLAKENADSNEYCLQELEKENEQLRSALEEIRNYCDRIEQGSVIGTQDCLINSIKNITNEVLNENTAN